MIALAGMLAAGSGYGERMREHPVQRRWTGANPRAIITSIPRRRFGMRLFVAITDSDWFDYLSELKPDEVNFWRPSGAESLPFLVTR